MKKIAITLLLLAGMFLGAACSQEEEKPKGPVGPTASPKGPTDPALLNVERRSERKKADVATAIVPAEASATATPISTPIP